MSNLKDQIEERLKKERDRSGKPEPEEREYPRETGPRLDDIRPQLDELAHKADSYSLSVGYEKGPYEKLIAVVELDDSGGTWVAAWQIATTVGGSVNDWEVTYNPNGVDTRREWFANSEDLFAYLTASIADRIVELETDGN